MCMRMLAEGLSTEFIGSIPITLEMVKHYCFLKSQRYLRPKITFVDNPISSECEDSLVPLTRNATELKNNPHIKLNIHCVFLTSALSNYNCLLFLTI